MKTVKIPCCENHAKHVTCPDGEHVWEEVKKGDCRDHHTIVNDSMRCRVCHINKVWYDANKEGGR